MRADRYICLSTLFSNWGDRMWQFAVGIYLVKLTPGSLQLAAIYGLVVSFSAIIFSPMIGEWVDRNARLKVVRILLVLQNLLVIVCALIVLLYLFEVTKNSHINALLKVLIIVSGSCANLAGQGEKIAVGKDWVVVVSRGSKELLTHTNAMIRRIDLTVAILAPLAVGLLMSLISDAAGIIFICSWNVVSMFGEYFLLLKVYHLIPELADKKVNGDAETVEKNNEDPTENSAMNIEEPVVKKVASNWNFFARFKTVVLGWKVYQRQNVFLAGCSLAALYLTVLGFGAITLGYAYVEGLSEFYVSMCLGLGSLFGVLATFLFPKICQKVGLVKTGLVGFFMQWSMLLFCVISIWLPGSPSEMYSGSSTELSPATDNTSSAIINVTLTTAATRLLNTTTVYLGNLTTTLSPVPTTSATPAKNLTSIIVLMAGVILSRSGLWISDLTITQLQQENVPEEERGVVGGVQYSFNCILDLLRYALTIALPYHDQFGYLTLMSFSAVACSGIIYTIFLIRFTRRATSPVFE